MGVSEDTKRVTHGLDDFCLPAALVHLGRDRFVAWNQSFAEAVECSDGELKIVPVHEILSIAVEAVGSGEECEQAPAPVHLEACTVKTPGQAEVRSGRAFRREDDYVFLILEPLLESDQNSYTQGALAGRQEERERLRRALHDSVSQHLVAASFALEKVKTELKQAGQPEAAEIASVQIASVQNTLTAIGDAIKQVISANG
jgi:signal transduction histidine kinase